MKKRICPLYALILLPFFFVPAFAEQPSGEIQPDDKFLSSIVILRQDVMDLGEMKVRQYVELIAKMGRSDGTPADIKGWTKDGNTYKLNADIGEPVVVEFDFDGMVSQLQPIKTKRGTVSPMEFTMQLQQNLQVAMMREAQKEAEPILAEIESLEAKQKEQLALLDQGIDKGLGFVRADIEMWKQEQTKLISKQKKLQAKIGPVLSERVECMCSLNEKLLALHFAKEEFKAFIPNSLAAGAKLVNDAIIAQNLEADLLPRNGEFLEGEIYGEVEYRCAVFANMIESHKNLYDDVSSATKLQTGNITRYFFHFPRQIEDESVKKAFVELYQEFDARMRRDGRIEHGNPVWMSHIAFLHFEDKGLDLRTQAREALKKFDYKKEAQVEGYQKLLSKFGKDMVDLEQTEMVQAGVAALIARKEAVLKAPEDNLRQALRKEIEQIFVEKRESLEDDLKQIKERLGG